MGIIQIDMHIRDERVLDYLRSMAHNHVARVTIRQIAETFKCTEKTANSILKRLRAAGRISIELPAIDRIGYSYRILDDR